MPTDASVSSQASAEGQAVGKPVRPPFSSDLPRAPLDKGAPVSASAGNAWPSSAATQGPPPRAATPTPRNSEPLAHFRHLGILIQPMCIIPDNVVAGRLVPMLRDWTLPRLTINIAYPTRRHLPAKVRCFVDFPLEQFETQDFERRWTA